jgi:hypothetical protein
MGEITQFMNVDEANMSHRYRHKLWHALEDWQNYTKKWQSNPFHAVDIQEITTLSE